MPAKPKSSPARLPDRPHPRPVTLSLADRAALAERERRVAVIADRVRSAALGYATGFYLAGRAGTGKTHTVRHTLEELRVTHHYHAGHLTPQGLFELLGRYPDRVLVLDDVASILGQPVALQYLLAALVQPSHGDRSRAVRYHRQGTGEVVYFSGSIVSISNLELHAQPLLQALKSRVPYLSYDPSEAQMAALMRSVAVRGWQSDRGELSPSECAEVAEHLIAESVRLNVRLDLRLLVDKAFPDYLQYRERDAHTHWRDLVTTTLQERLVELTHTASTPLPRQRVRLAAEARTALEIREEFASPSEQLAEWEARTGKGRRNFYRRLGDAGVPIGSGGKCQSVSSAPN